MKPYIKLTGVSKKVFDELAKHLDDHGVLTIDRLKLTVLAQSFGLYADAVKRLDEDGYVNIHNQIHPCVTAMEKAINAIIKISPSFGIDPASRERILSFNSKKDDLPDFS